MNFRHKIYAIGLGLALAIGIWFTSTISPLANQDVVAAAASENANHKANTNQVPPGQNAIYRARDFEADLERCSQSSDFELLLRHHFQLKSAWTTDAAFLSYFFQKWSEVSPVDAINGISLLPDDFRGREMRGEALKRMKNVYENWPEEVFEACELLNNDEKRSVMSSVIRIMSSKGKEPQKALAYISENHGLGIIRQSLLSTLFDEWSTHDPDAARKAASSLPYPEERSAAHSTISKKLKGREQQQKLMQEAGIIE